MTAATSTNTSEVNIGIGLEVMHHPLTFYLKKNGGNYFLEGQYTVEVEEELLKFDIKVSGKYLLFDLIAEEGENLKFSIKKIAQKLFGENDMTNNFPEIEFDCKRIFFLFLKNSLNQFLGIGFSKVNFLLNFLRLNLLLVFDLTTKIFCLSLSEFIIEIAFKVM